MPLCLAIRAKHYLDQIPIAKSPSLGLGPVTSAIFTTLTVVLVIARVLKEEV